MTTKSSGGRTKYDRQRPRKTPPHMSLRFVRMAVGLTLDEVAERVAEVDPSLRPTRGALSAIESGTRGASPELLAAISVAFGTPDEALVTNFEPRARSAAA